MAAEVILPRVDMDMAAAKITRWFVDDGATATAGNPLFEIETDKAAMEIEAPASGIVRLPGGTRLGEAVPVGTVVAYILAPGEALPEQAAPPAATAPAAAPATPAAAGTGTMAPAPAPAEGELRASPLARRLAREAGLDLHTLKGSGPNGRIVKADIEAAQRRAAPAPPAAPAPAAAPAAAAAPAPAAPVPVAAPHHLLPHSTMRQVIARRLSAAKQSIPHFYVAMDIELDALLKLRAELNARGAQEGAGGFKLSVNDMLIKAAAATLRRLPRVNAAWSEAGTILYDDIDISVAVSIPEGLITPIVRQADRKGLLAISAEMKDLAARARAGKLKPEEFQGGSFSISNMGMYGVAEFAAIINPPQGAILAVGAGQPRPVVKAGAVAVATVMTCTLSVDHRVIDGALGAEWLAEFRRIVEDPLSLLL